MLLDLVRNVTNHDRRSEILTAEDFIDIKHKPCFVLLRLVP